MKHQHAGRGFEKTPQSDSERRVCETADPMKKHYVSLITCSIAAALILQGCALASREDPIVVADIEKEFALDMRESLDSSSRELQLRISTVKTFDCSNYSIQYAWRRQNNDLLLSLLRIAAPLVCDGVESKITANTGTGSLSLGNYKFSIDLRGVLTNKGVLSNLPDRYRLRMDTEHGLIIPNKELMKIPQESIWGYAAYSPALKSKASEFAQEFYALTQAANYQAGYYGYYAITDLGLNVENQPKDQDAFPFLRKMQLSDRKNILALVQKYRQQYPTGLTISVLDGWGRAY